MCTSDSFQYNFLQEYQRGWGVVRGGGGGGGGYSLSFDVQGRGGGGSPDLGPFGHTEKEGEGEGCKNWTFFMDVINVWSLTKMKYLKRYY